MDDELDAMVIAVRADTRDAVAAVAALRTELKGPLEAGARRAGRAIEGALLDAVRGGSIGFDDLKRHVLSVMDAIAASALRGGIDALTGNSGGIAGAILGLIGGAPGRATGGPVSPGRAYRVGERGPELFVPTTSGSVLAPPPEGGGRDVRVTITVHAGAGEAPAALARSGRQVARAVRAALADV